MATDTHTAEQTGKCCTTSPEHRAVSIFTDTIVDFTFRDVFGQAKVSDLYQTVIFYQYIASSQVSMDVSL